MGLETKVNEFIEKKYPNLRSAYSWFGRNIILHDNDKGQEIANVLTRSDKFGKAVYSSGSSMITFRDFKKGSLTNRKVAQKLIRLAKELISANPEDLNLAADMANVFQWLHLHGQQADTLADEIIRRKLFTKSLLNSYLRRWLKENPDMNGLTYIDDLPTIIDDLLNLFRKHGKI